MKSIETDVLLICKRRFDRTRFASVKEAMDAWYRKNYLISEEMMPEIPYRLYVENIFPSCIELFLNERTKASFIYYLTRESVGEFLEKKNVNDEELDIYKGLFLRITYWLSRLQIKDGNLIFIYIDDYKEDEDGDLIHI